MNVVESGQEGSEVWVRVNKGDTVHLSVNANYEGEPKDDKIHPALFNIASGGVMSNIASPLEGAVKSTENALSQAVSGLTAMDEGNTDEAPKAYLNYTYFDEDKQPVRSGFQQVSTAAEGVGAHETLKIDNIVADQQGYVKAYLSNETRSASRVNFDDFRVVQGKTSVVQSEDYYPFGLTFNDYRRTGSAEQNFKYNGIERIKDLDLNLDMAEFRSYSPALGRFIQIDPMADVSQEQWTPYHNSFNNPIRFIDPTGLFAQEGSQYIASTFVDKRGEIIDHRNDGDDNIYLVDDPDNWDGKKDDLYIVGKEMKGKEYKVGDEITAGDLTHRGVKIMAAANGVHLNYNFMTGTWDVLFMGVDMALMIGGAGSLYLRNIKGTRGSGIFPRNVRIVIRNNVQVVMGKDYVPVASKAVPANSADLVKALNKKSPGTWSKVYEAGFLNGKKVEVHYFVNKQTGQVFDVKVKRSGSWSNTNFGKKAGGNKITGQ